jgi:pilus assembly protein CpaE
MSEENTQSLSILLPDSAVSVYSTHKDTLQAALQQMQDWRFARVKIQAVEANVKQAAIALKDQVSPDLVIIQTDKIDEGFTQDLEALAASCDENTAAIVIGPVNDVYLYRRLIDMGVSDYLVHPVGAAAMGDVIAKTLIERKCATGTSLIGIVGAKGGVGASTIATALAWGASDILDQKTVLVDAAGGWSTLSVSIGFEPSTTLSSAARATANKDEDSIKRMLFKASDKLNVLASGSDAMLAPAISDSQIESILDNLMAKFPVVIVDLSHASPETVRTVASRANHIIVVSTPTLPSLRLARSLVHEIKDLRGKDHKNIEMIINMHGLAAAHEVPCKDIEQAMDFKVSTIVPYNAKVFIGNESRSQKLTQDKDGDLIFRTSLLPLLSRILEREASSDSGSPSKAGLLGSLMSKLKKGS